MASADPTVPPPPGVDTPVPADAPTKLFVSCDVAHKDVLVPVSPVSRAVQAAAEHREAARDAALRTLCETHAQAKQPVAARPMRERATHSGRHVHSGRVPLQRSAKAYA